MFLALALLGLATGAEERRNLAVTPAPAQAVASEKRVALVIGNSSYQKGPLRNPVNDAADIAAKLRALGFDVVERTDIKTSQIGRTLREFRSRLTPGSIALFFYAGHGLQIKGENYLPAVDADIDGEEDAPNQSIAVRQVMDIMEDAKTRLNLAFLDACRNNPYARSFRSGADGLARISAPSGTLISFATRPGSVAADGTGRNGLYTSHLLQAIEQPNLPVELMLKQVTAGVKAASRGQQEPWMEGSIEGDFQFRVVAVPQVAVIPAAEAEKARREAVEQALQEAQRRSREDEARTREQEATRLAHQKAEQAAATERAVQEALRRSNEQAAKERAELQASMQRLIEEALIRQRGSTPAAASAAVVASVSEAPARTSPSPMTSASTARPLADPGQQGKGPKAGDEWEYLVRETIWGKQKRLLWRVRGAEAAGVLEELLVDGRSTQDWAFNGAPDVVGVPTETGMFFGSHWDGSRLPTLPVSGTGDCAVKLRCEVLMKVAGKETVSVPAGNFDVLRIDGNYLMSPNTRFHGGTFTVWYSESDRRVIRQVVTRNATMWSGRMNEVYELQSVRSAAR